MCTVASAVKTILSIAVEFFGCYSSSYSQFSLIRSKLEIFMTEFEDIYIYIYIYVATKQM
jgi:hypothetical protein